MLQISDTQNNQELAVEKKDIPLNFDSRIARDLVVTVTALDTKPGRDASSNLVSVGISPESRSSLVDDLLVSVAKTEISILESKRAYYPNSAPLLNHLPHCIRLLATQQQQ